MPETVLVAIPTRPAEQFAGALEDSWAEGAAVLPFDPAHPTAVTRAIFEALRPGQVKANGKSDRLEGGHPVESNIALVVMTSGSLSSNASKIKAAELSHSALQASASASIERLAGSRGDRWLCCLSFAHIAGLAGLARARMLGSAPVVHDPFDPQAFGEIEAEYVSLVPAMLKSLLDQAVPLSRFKAVLLGGGPVPKDLLARARAEGVNVVVTYGMTESFGGCVYDGRPLSRVEVAADEQSRIRISGPVLMNGYRLRADLTQGALQKGWLLTNDFGRIGEDGLLHVAGRADRLIITGGHNVNPGEVEQRLTEHPSITGALVMGLEDPRWGEVVGALVESSAELAPRDITDFVRESLPAFMAPRRVAVVRSLPRTSIGKPDAVAGKVILEKQA